MSIQERILQVIDLKSITAYRFCKDLGFSMGYLDKRGAIGTDKYLKIIEYLKDINPIWLLTGEGEMLKNEVQKEVSAPVTGQNTSILEQENAFLKKDIQRLEEQIKDKDKIISTLESNQKLLQEKLSAYEKSHNFAIATQSATRPAL